MYEASKILLCSKDDLSMLAPDVERQITLMYDALNSIGLDQTLMAGGAYDIVKRYLSLIPKYGAVVCAFDKHELIGVCYGHIKQTPKHYGGGVVGFLEGIFIDAKYRRSGISRGLYNRLEAWFVEAGASAIDLHVLLKNEASRHMFANHGYTLSFLQMRKKL